MELPPEVWSLIIRQYVTDETFASVWHGFARACRYFYQISAALDQSESFWEHYCWYRYHELHDVDYESWRKTARRYWMPADCKYITKTTAIRDYKLKPAELEQVPHISKQNPHYKSAAEMQLFHHCSIIDVFGEISALRQTAALERKAKIEANKLAKKKKRDEQIEKEGYNVNELKMLGLNITNLSVCWTKMKKAAVAKLERQSKIAEMGYNRQDILATLRIDITDTDTDWQSIVVNLTSRQDRHMELTTALHNCGLELREDSECCRNYIKHGGRLQDVVHTMAEMNWWFTYTTYETEHVEYWYEMDYTELSQCKKVQAARSYSRRHMCTESHIKSLPVNVQPYIRTAAKRAARLAVIREAKCAQNASKRAQNASKGTTTPQQVLCTCGSLSAVACSDHKCGNCCNLSTCVRHYKNDMYRYCI